MKYNTLENLLEKINEIICVHEILQNHLELNDNAINILDIDEEIAKLLLDNLDNHDYSKINKIVINKFNLNEGIVQKRINNYYNEKCSSLLTKFTESNDINNQLSTVVMDEFLDGVLLACKFKVLNENDEKKYYFNENGNNIVFSSEDIKKIFNGIYYKDKNKFLTFLMNNSKFSINNNDALKFLNKVDDIVTSIDQIIVDRDTSIYMRNVNIKEAKQIKKCVIKCIYQSLYDMDNKRELEKLYNALCHISDKMKEKYCEFILFLILPTLDIIKSKKILNSDDLDNIIYNIISSNIVMYDNYLSNSINYLKRSNFLNNLHNQTLSEQEYLSNLDKIAKKNRRGALSYQRVFNDTKIDYKKKIILNDTTLKYGKTIEALRLINDGINNFPNVVYNYDFIVNVYTNELLLKNNLCKDIIGLTKYNNNKFAETEQLNNIFYITDKLIESGNVSKEEIIKSIETYISILNKIDIINEKDENKLQTKLIIIKRIKHILAQEKNIKTKLALTISNLYANCETKEDIINIDSSLNFLIMRNNIISDNNKITNCSEFNSDEYKKLYLLSNNHNKK